MKKSLKCLSVFLSMCLLLCLLPVFSLAEHDENALMTVYQDDEKTLLVMKGEETQEKDGIWRYLNGDVFHGPYNNPDYDDAPGLWNMEEGKDPEEVFEIGAKIETVRFLDGAKPPMMALWFANLTALKNILHFDLIDTSDADMTIGMFLNCASLETLDLSSFDTGNVENMSYMFFGCSSLSALDLGSFNTEKVEEMMLMFAGCENLSELNIGSFHTDNVENMILMFAGCSNLSEIDLSGFNTENVSNMEGLFAGCSSLRSLDLSSFSISEETGMAGMFGACTSLSSLTLGENFRFTFNPPPADDEDEDDEDEDDGDDFLSDLIEGIDLESPALPEPPQNGMYTGYWVKEGGNGTRLTSKQLMETYDGATMAGTWKWELAEQQSLAGATVTAADQVYTGEALTPAVTVTLDGQTLTENVDYTVDYANNTEAGTASITVTGINAYKDTAGGTFEIIRKPAEPTTIATAEVTVDVRNCTDSNTKPAVTVKLDGVTLTQDRDYTVSYTFDKNTGNGSVIVKGIGNYKDSTTVLFKVTNNTTVINNPTPTTPQPASTSKQPSFWDRIVEFFAKIFRSLHIGNC